MNNEKENLTGNGIHHTFAFVPFGSGFSAAIYFNFFNEEEDCGNLRSTLERAADSFRQAHPYISAAVFLIFGNDGEAVLYELYDTNHVPTKANNSSFRSGFRKGGYFSLK